MSIDFNVEKFKLLTLPFFQPGFDPEENKRYLCITGRVEGCDKVPGVCHIRRADLDQVYVFTEPKEMIPHDDCNGFSVRHDPPRMFLAFEIFRDDNGSFYKFEAEPARKTLEEVVKLAEKHLGRKIEITSGDREENRDPADCKCHICVDNETEDANGNEIKRSL